MGANSTKIEIMMDSLSKERQIHMQNIITGFSNDIIQKGAKLNSNYKIEVTERFDKEQPIQFVWMNLNIYLSQNPNGITSNVDVLDMEVYKESEIDHWLDHNERIKKESNIYHSKEGTVVNDFDKNESHKIISDIEDEMSDEQMVTEQKWLYMELFSSIDTKRKTNQEYISLFQRYMIMFSNRASETYIATDMENAFDSYCYLREVYNRLMNEFQECDFTNFSKEELLTLGFVNFRNKMLLMPVWAYPVILRNNEGLKLKDIHSNEFIVGKQFIDGDNNNGNMNIGFEIVDNNLKFEYDK